MPEPWTYERARSFSGRYVKVPLAARFWTKVNKTEACWIWTAATGNSGYGIFWDGQRLNGAHRVSYEMHHGPIPEGHEVDHICRVRLCVRPEHLRALTRRENLLAPGATTIIKRCVSVTHCPKGHAYEGDNLRIRNGQRKCRACHRERQRERDRRARA